MSVSFRLHPSFLAISLIALAFLMVLALAFAPGAEAAKLKNGDFEKGNFSGWKRDATTDDGRWVIYKRGKPMPISESPKPKTIKGKFSAVSDMDGPSTMILYRDFKLPKKASLKSAILTFHLKYWNASGLWYPSLPLDDFSGNNQQFRVDLMKPKNSAKYSTKKSVILKNIIRSKNSTDLESKKLKFKVNLNKWAGKTIRLRFANANNQGPLHIVVDNVNVSIKTK